MTPPIGRNSNPFLSAAMAVVRRARPLASLSRPYVQRIETYPGGDMLQLWFITGGCSWDACTMCDYGQGPKVDVDVMVDAVEQGLRSVDLSRLAYLEVTPSGSMLDPREVPPEALKRILARLRETPVPVILFETRAETVSHDTVAQVLDSLAGKQVAVLMGLESSSPWVQRYCVNKGTDPSRFVEAARVFHAHGVEVIANVSLGTAFLSPREALDDAVATVRWALDNGADHAVLYPLQVKQHTLIARLFRLGSYHSPSLWSLVEALDRLGPALLPRVTTAWYRNYFGDFFVDTATTCPKCHERVLTLLDAYHASQTPASLEPLKSFECRCRKSWREELQMTLPPLPQRVLEDYAHLAGALGLEAVWDQRRAALEEALTNERGRLATP